MSDEPLIAVQIETEAWQLLLEGAESHLDDAIDEDGSYSEDEFQQILARARGIVDRLAARYLVDPRPGVDLTREQLEAWAGRPLTDEEVDHLDLVCVPNSSIPEAIGEIVGSFGNDFEGDEED